MTMGTTTEIEVPEMGNAGHFEDPETAAPDSPPYASPLARRLGRTLGIDLRRVAGTGRRGRIRREDLERLAGEAGRGGEKAPAHYVTSHLAGHLASRGTPPSWAPSLGPPAGPSLGPSLGNGPRVDPDDPSRFGPVEILPLTRLQRLEGARAHRTWRDVPHVTHHALADVTDLEAFRQSIRQSIREADDTRGAPVTLLPFLLKAAAAALEAFPTFNASLAPDGETLIVKGYCHIGVAVDTPEGPVVPVIRDVDRKGIGRLAGELAALVARAREKRIAPDDPRGGCFTLSNLGGIGGTGFTPILNAPEVAILGVSRATIRPVLIDGRLRPRRMLPLSLSYDHRVIDGANGARFAAFFCSRLADVRRLLL